MIKTVRVCTLLLGLALLAPGFSAHSPVVDSDLEDWCLGAFSNTAPGGGRVEDSAASLSCGNCSTSTALACAVDADCPGAETCVNLGSRTEIVWWDNRTDGSVNDLATVAFTWDDTNLYIAAELWVDPDPVSLPFGQIAIDYEAGGVDAWHDPLALMVNSGNCSVSTDRGCTSDEDCHFCPISTEPFPSTRVRTCGSGCDPDIMEVCDTSQVCLNLGDQGLISGVGADAAPPSGADNLLLFDFSLWLIGAGDAVLVMEPGTTIDPSSPWDPVTGCTPDDVTDNDFCDFPPLVNPGASGGSGGPPGAVEVAIPWEGFGCTGCPNACSCPGLGPDVPFRFTMTVARGTLSLDFRPDGAHEDVLTEMVGGTTTTSNDDCAGFGIGNTECELADGSADAYVPRSPALPYESTPGGRNTGLTVGKAAGGQITLGWAGSCAAGDNAYGVYEGTIGAWNSHAPAGFAGSCAVAGNTATFAGAGGSTYYLVVPNDGSNEGSYGEDTISGERLPSSTPCGPQVLGNCP